MVRIFKINLTFSSLPQIDIWVCLSADYFPEIFDSVCYVSTMTELLGICITILFIYWILVKIRGNSKLPPGPFGLPIVGYLPFLDSKNPQKSMQELAFKYGDIFSLQMGQLFCVVLSDQELIKTLFSKRKFFYTKNNMESFFKELIYFSGMFRKSSTLLNAWNNERIWAYLCTRRKVF